MCICPYDVLMVGEIMKKNLKGSLLKGATIVLLLIALLIGLLEAGGDSRTSEYFAQAPSITHLSPEKIAVSWKPYPGFNTSTHYQVQTNHALYGFSTKHTAKTVEHFQPGGTYSIAVVTYDNGSAVGVSSPTTILMAPAAPAAIGTYDLGSASVGLFWQKVDTAIGYRVYHASDTLLQELTATQTRVFFSGFTPGSLVKFRLTAFNTTGESYYADIAVQLLPPPPVFSVIENQVGVDWFSFKWTPVENALSYQVLINESAVATLASTITEHRIDGLPAGDTISLRMTAQNPAGYSEQSEALLIQLLPAAPVLALTEVSSYSCTLQWAVANGAAYYKVYENEQWAIFNVPSSITTVTVTQNIVAGMTATYTVRAVNGTGESAHSNPVVVTYTSNSAIVRNAGDLTGVQATFSQFSDILPESLRGQPLVWVYFPPELEGPTLELEASYFEFLTATPELSSVRFIGVFTSDVSKVRVAKRPNLTWKKVSPERQIKIPGHLPMVRFYGPDGSLRHMIRISMAIMSPHDVFKEIPEAFERSDSNMLQLYQENRDRFETLHQK